MTKIEEALARIVATDQADAEATSAYIVASNRYYVEGDWSDEAAAALRAARVNLRKARASRAKAQNASVVHSAR